MEFFISTALIRVIAPIKAREQEKFKIAYLSAVILPFGNAKFDIKM